MAETITVKELYAHCKRAIKDGYGDKKILISDDDEGNGYHELFYQFTPVDCIGSDQLPYGVTEEDAINDYITLG